MSAFGWDSYANALRLLAKAPQAAQSKRDAIAEEVARRTAEADAKLRAAVAQHELLEERLARVEGLARKLSGQVGDGPAQAVVAPKPADVRESLAILATFEELLGQAPPAAAKPKKLWWVWVAGALAVATILVMIWSIWR